METKGFDILLHALARLPEPRLQLVGDGPERARLERLCDRLGLRQRVEFLGHRHDVPALLQQADLCVISSRREGFSYVFAESLRANTPVLATDVPVANEFLPPRFIVPCEDPSALAQGLARCLEDLPALQRAYEPLFLRAREQLSTRAMVRQTEDFYRRLLQKRG